MLPDKLDIQDSVFLLKIENYLKFCYEIDDTELYELTLMCF